MVRRSRPRPTWEHGCDGGCGRKRAGNCPERQQTRPETDDTKSEPGRRAIGLPDELVALLKEHRAEQDTQRAAAGQLWTEKGWVFATQTGAPINPRTDYDPTWLIRLAREAAAV